MNASRGILLIKTFPLPESAVGFCIIRQVPIQRDGEREGATLDFSVISLKYLPDEIQCVMFTINVLMIVTGDCLNLISWPTFYIEKLSLRPYAIFCPFINCTAALLSLFTASKYVS